VAVEAGATAVPAHFGLLFRRLLGGSSALAQLWFRAEVLQKYRGGGGFKLIRTNSVGRLRGPQWSIDFGIAGEGDSLIHVSAGEAAERIPEAERDHWVAHAVGLPVSANYLLMQATRGACVDDGDVRGW
jgi:hypothetical protein